MSLNKGPWVGDTNMGFTISTAHVKQVGNLLFDWVEELPVEVSSCIEAIVVGPCRSASDRISIKVFLSQVLSSDTGSPREKCLGWKKHIEVHIYGYNPKQDIDREWEVTKRSLNEVLSKALWEGIESYKTIIAGLEKMTEKIELVGK